MTFAMGRKLALPSTRIIDLFSIQPIDRETLIEASRVAGGVFITVEDHYAHGGLGDAVLAAQAEERVSPQTLAVREMPHCGKPCELLDRYCISARQITETARRVIREGVGRQEKIHPGAARREALNSEPRKADY